MTDYNKKETGGNYSHLYNKNGEFRSYLKKIKRIPLRELKEQYKLKNESIDDKVDL